MGFFSFYTILIYVCMALPSNNGITTTHYNKPGDSEESATSLEYVTDLPTLNITLTPSERQKRLLPYENFYTAQKFNLPSNQQQQSQQAYTFQGQRYQFGTVLRKTPQNAQQTKLYQQQKYTPFLESNAIPGPFIPMSSAQQQPQKIQVQLIQIQPQEEKVPNYSSIYEKLAQLKYMQRRPIYVQSYRAPQRFNIVHPKTTQQQSNFIPISNYEAQTIQPTKTVVETYTATNIDVPAAPVDAQYNQQQEQYQQIPTPMKSPSNIKQYHQEVRKPYAQPLLVQVPQTYQARKPIIIVQQKPTLNDHPKTYHYRGENLETIPITKPIVYVPRKQTYRPKLVIVTEDTPQQPQQQKYISLLKYTENPTYPNIVPQTYQQQIPKYEQVEKYEPPKYTQMQVKYEDENPEEPQYEEQPKYEAPKYEAPKYEAPKYEAPKYEAPKYMAVPVTYAETSPKYEGPSQVQYVQPHSYQHYAPATEVPRATTESSNNLAVILKHLQDTNTLPHTLTPENIDNSIKTLVKILGTLRKQQKLSKPIIVPEENNDYSEEENETDQPEDGTITQTFPLDSPEGGTPGKPGVDYPALSSIPQTSFNCKTQRYKGFFGDPDTNCQVWHYCDLNGGQASFLCPNGTIFSQVALTCDWWYNVKCASTAQLYVLNERLYKYIIPLTPKFPEDYSGPLVDKYLAMKFQEMEEKMRKEKKGKQQEEDKEKESEELQDIEEDEEKDDEPKETKVSDEKQNTLQSIESGDK